MNLNPSDLSLSVLEALRTVQDPDLKKDLVSLGMIQDLKATPEGQVSFRVVLTTPACPMKAKIERECREAVEKLPGVHTVQIQMDARVTRSTLKHSVQPIPGVQQIIAVSSGKGGVGKSTVAVNLAVSLALEGAKVGLLDADIYGPNVPLMMGVMEPPQMIQDSDHPEKGERFVPSLAHHVKVMSMGFLLPKDQPVIWRGPMLHQLVSQFCHQVQWEPLDYLIVDMPPGTGDVQLSLAQLVPVTGAVLVTTPQEVAMQDVRRAFHMFEKVKIPVMGVVENMSFFECGECHHSHFLFGQGGGKELARVLQTELLGEVPLLPALRRGADEGEPIVIRLPESSAALAFRELARKVAQQVSILSYQKTQAALAAEKTVPQAGSAQPRVSSPLVQMERF